MSEKPIRGRRAPRERGGQGGLRLVAGVAALLSIAAVVVSIYSVLQRSSTASAEIQLPYILAAGGGIIIAAVVAQVRDMSASDILEAVWHAIAGLFALIGAIFRGIWTAILGLFGLD